MQDIYLAHLHFTEDRKNNSVQQTYFKYILALTLARNFTQWEKMINDDYITKNSFHMSKQTFPRNCCYLFARAIRKVIPSCNRANPWTWVRGREIHINCLKAVDIDFWEQLELGSVPRNVCTHRKMLHKNSLIYAKISANLMANHFEPAPWSACHKFGYTFHSLQ